MGEDVSKREAIDGMRGLAKWLLIAAEMLEKHAEEIEPEPKKTQIYDKPEMPKM